MLARQGNDMVYLLETMVQDCERDGIPFHAVVHPYFLQKPQLTLRSRTMHPIFLDY